MTLGISFAARQHQRQRSRPKRFRQLVRERRPARDAALRHVDARDMDDDGIVRRPALDLEDALHRPGIQRVGRQPIHRLGRQCGHLSPPAAVPPRDAPRPGTTRACASAEPRRQLVALLFHGGNLPATAPKAREKSRPGAAQIARARSGLAAYPALGRTHLLGDISPLVSPLPLRSLAVARAVFRGLMHLSLIVPPLEY
jgi:hypothetical protein